MVAPDFLEGAERQLIGPASGRMDRNSKQFAMTAFVLVFWVLIPDLLDLS